MKPISFLIVPALAFFSSVYSQDLKQLTTKQEQRLTLAREELSNLRQQHTKAILPLQKQLRLLRAEERLWKKRFDEHQSVQDSI